MDEAQQIELEAAAFRALRDHLRARPDVQNIDLMTLAGFCRNCLARWYQEAAAERGLDLSTYERAWEWSVDDLEGFWSEVVREFDVRLTTPATRVLSGRDMPGARWFEGATLNYARDVLLGGADDALAIVGESQSRDRVALTFAELRRDVARFAAGLRSLGVGPGDRVAAYLPLDTG